MLTLERLRLALDVASRVEVVGDPTVLEAGRVRPLVGALRLPSPEDPLPERGRGVKRSAHGQLSSRSILALTPEPDFS